MNRYYEVKEPYYALIRANDKEQAVDEYIRSVAGEEGEREELLETIKDMPIEKAIMKFLRSPAEEGDISHYEYLEQKNPLVLLIDGSLL